MIAVPPLYLSHNCQLLSRSVWFQTNGPSFFSWCLVVCLVTYLSASPIIESVYKLTFLVLRLLVFQVSTTATSVPELTLGDFLVHSTLPLDYFDGTITGGQTTTVPWAPTDENLIVNITITQGEPAYVGWTFPSVEGTPDGGTIFDGFAKNITVFYTPPTGSEKMVFSYSNGPRHH
ncbi:hypothetical protein C8J57DRAFT_170420 [Mycena rebaudengoi]|nr:hypothetical protein C8J57DRAFT_170420 [Mycena rebaudengoi]